MSRFLDALQCKNSDVPPIWLMRQAGRYLPEYMELRQKHSLEDMFRTPDIATEVTLQPIRRFGLDAAILFADILTPCEGFGLKASFADGPKVIGEKGDFAVEKLSHVEQTIKQLKQQLDVPLIGFCGGPVTIGKYLKTHVSLEEMTEAMIAYLQMQIDAGVDAVQIFDSWAGLLPREEFMDKAWPHLKRIVDAIRPFPTIVFMRGSCNLIDELVALEPTAISFDWDLPMREIRKRVPRHIAVQGNLNPEMLKGEDTTAITELFESMEDEPGFIFNVGHGLSPDIPVSAVAQLKSQRSLVRH